MGREVLANVVWLLKVCDLVRESVREDLKFVGLVVLLRDSALRVRMIFAVLVARLVVLREMM